MSTKIDFSTLDVVAEIFAIQEAANNSNTSIRIVPEGKVGHQGDVYVHPVSIDHIHGARTFNMQIAEGNTKGARHVVVGEDVKVYVGVAAPPNVSSVMLRTSTLLGPVIVAPKGFTLTHPDHPHHIYGPGTYQVTFQFDPIIMRAVLD